MIHRTGPRLLSVIASSHHILLAGIVAIHAMLGAFRGEFVLCLGGMHVQAAGGLVAACDDCCAHGHHEAADPGPIARAAHDEHHAGCSCDGHEHGPHHHRGHDHDHDHPADGVPAVPIPPDRPIPPDHEHEPGEGDLELSIVELLTQPRIDDAEPAATVEPLPPRPPAVVAWTLDPNAAAPPPPWSRRPAHARAGPPAVVRTIRLRL